MKGKVNEKEVKDEWNVVEVAMVVAIWIREVAREEETAGVDAVKEGCQGKIMS